MREIDPRALDQHPDVIAARARAAAAEAASAESGSWPNPELDGRVLFGEEGEEYEIAMQAALPLGGRLGAERQLARLELALARSSLRAARQTARIELELAMTRLTWARVRRDHLEELATQSDQYAGYAREREATSVADPLEVSLVLADAAQDRRAALRSLHDVTQAEWDLRQLLGQTVEISPLPSRPLVGLRLSENAAMLLEGAREQCESWRQADLMLQHAEWDAARASRERIPDLLIGPAVASDGVKTSLGLVLGWELPLFRSGSGAYREALARRDAAHGALALEARAVRARIETLVSRLRTLEAELQALTRDAAPAAERAFALAQNRYAAGRIDVLHLLSAHRASAQSKLEILDVLLAQRMTLLDLEGVVGRPIRTDPTPPIMEANP